MKKRWLENRWVFLLFCVTIPLLIGAAGKNWIVKAPGGSDADLEQNTISYYGADNLPVELTTEDGMVLHANQLDYRQKEETFHGIGNVDLLKSQPKLRELIGSDLFYDSLKDDFAMASGGQIKFGPEQTSLSAGVINGNLKKETFIASNNCRLTDTNGVLTSNRMDGDNSTGIFNAYEQVVFVGKKAVIHSGAAVYYQKDNKADFTDKPTVTQDDKVFSATEIVYDMKNNRIKAIGPVQCIAPGPKGGNN